LGRSSALTFEDSTAYSGYDKRVYELVPMGSRVLDVGCASGDLAKALIEGKGCVAIGVEKHPERAGIARRHCKVITADIEEDEPDLPQGSFDVMIFADVLEHLRNPDSVLRKFKKFLKDEGLLIVAIPNVAFISVRLSLLLGRFNYVDCGILERGHLRFFTMDTAKSLIESSGYKVLKVHSYIPWQRRYFLLGIAGLIWRRLFSMKFIITARKA